MLPAIHRATTTAITIASYVMSFHSYPICYRDHYHDQYKPIHYNTPVTNDATAMRAITTAKMPAPKYILFFIDPPGKITMLCHQRTQSHIDSRCVQNCLFRPGTVVVLSNCKAPDWLPIML